MKGEGNQQDYGMRVYDPRLGKFLSVDPLTKSYPWNSPYSFAENDVIRSIDLDGMEKVIVNGNSITLKLQYAVFTEREEKVIAGVSYPGGNIPNTSVSADVIMGNAFAAFKKVSATEVYELTIRPDITGTKILSVSDNSETNKPYTLNIEYEVLKFRNEEEMKSSKDYLESIANETFAGMALFGRSSYGDLGNGKESPLVMANKVAAHAYGTDGTNPNHIILVGLGSYNDEATYIHEIGHNLGVGHRTQGDDFVPMENGPEYNTKGMMKGTRGAPEAPFKPQLIRMMNTLKGTIQK